MEKFATLLRVHSERILEVATEHVEVSDCSQEIGAVIEQLSGGVPLDVAPLRDKLSNDQLLARLLRCIQSQVIEVIREKLDTEAFAVIVVHIRTKIGEAIRQFVKSKPVAMNVCDCLQAHLLQDEQDDADQSRSKQAHLLAEGIVSVLRDSVFVLDLYGNFIFLNQQALNMTKFVAQDLEGGLSIYDLLPLDYADIVDMWLESPGTKARSPFTIEFNAKDGERVLVEISAGPLAESMEIPIVVAVARDMRLERRLEMKLHEANRYFGALFTNSTSGIIVTDSDAVIVDANPVAVSLCGAEDVSDLAGISIDEISAAPDNSLKVRVLEVVENQSVVRRPFSLMTRFGASIDGDSLIIPVVVSEGKADGALIMFVDASDETQMRETLVQSERLSALGELVAGVAHELNNPLTGIMGYSQLLLKEMEIPDKRKSQLEHIAIEASRCQRIVQGLLSFARHRDSEKTQQNINDTLRETVELREYQLRADGIDFTAEYAPGIPLVFADHHALQQVFLNLVNNAHHALLNIEGRKRELRIETKLRDDSVCVSFRDNGSGIPRDIQSRIFDPFFTTKDVDSGTGLGLSVSYGIVQNHHGHILLKSGKNKGSTFTVVLPILEQDET